MDFQNKKILVQGLSISNLPVIQYLADKHLAKLTVTDLKPQEELQDLYSQAKEAYPEASFVLGSHNEKDFLEADMIIKNPSIPNTVPIIQQALSKGVSVESDVTLFFKLCPSKNIIGVTGTKGKTTTAVFLGKVLEDQGLDVVLAGNMGIPAMGELAKVTPVTWVVLELSSFMLDSMALQQLSPHIAIYTNIFPDHLNKYASFEDYITSKATMYKYQAARDILVLNKDDANLKEFSIDAQPKVLWYSEHDIPTDVKLHFTSGHYKKNIAASFVLAKELGLDIVKVKATAEAFTGVPYRMQNLGVIKGIEFINNTAATTPIAFLADIPEIASQRKPIYLLGGGADKKLDYEEMASLINTTPELVKLALFKGAATDKLIPLINQAKILGVYDSMSSAFAAVINAAKEGSIVALSPGCASFGVFNNEFDRGDQFNTEVEKFKNV